MSTNGELPPAPPMPRWTTEDRLNRVEELVVSAESGKLRREIEGLRSQVRQLADEVHLLRRGREGVYDSLHEVSMALMRQQRTVDRLEGQVRDLIVQSHVAGGA